MTLVVFLLLLVISGRGGAEVPSPGPGKSKRMLIVDADAGPDDGVAILNLLGAELLFQEFRIEFITAVRGNTHVDNVGRNILKVLKAANRLDIPVYKGANESLVATPDVGFYFGKDGFGDFDFPDPPPEDLIRKRHAVLALLRAVSQHPGKLTLVCLGPLTNIALAVRLNPEFLAGFKEIFVLGGTDSGVGNVKPGIEFNFHVDPEAAKIVFEEAEKRKKVLNVVTWETVARRARVDMKWRKEVLGAIKTPQVSLINKAERLTLGGREWISADTVLSSVVVDGQVVRESETHHADVEVCGNHGRASLFLDYDCCRNLTKNVRILKKLNVDLHKRLLLQTFSAAGAAGDPWKTPDSLTNSAR